MAFNNVLFLVAAFLLVTAVVSYSGKEFEEKVFSKMSAPAAAPIEAPILAPPLEAHPPPPPSPTVKQPTPSPPLAQPPTSAPPVKPPAAPLPPLNPPASPTIPPVRTIAECTPLCAGRCKLHSRPNVCNRACKTCCYRCKCVPPGTFGNREKCGKCYTDMTTHNNKPKCP